MLVPFAFLMLSSLGLAGDDAGADPDRNDIDRARSVLQDFADALKRKDVELARELAQPIEKPVDPDELNEKLTRLSNELSRPGASWTLQQGQADGTLALVIVEQRKSEGARADLDPILLIERDGSYKVMLDDPEQHGLNAEELAASQRLLDWYKEQKAKRKK